MRPDANINTKTGDCDCCERTNVALTRSTEQAGMMQCSVCYTDEQAAIAKRRSVEVIEQSIAIDETIVLQKDIHNASTVAFIELRAAIQNNDAIPADQKEYELVKMAAERIKIVKAAIIADEQALMAKKNEHHAWITQVQEVASRLRADYREKIKQYDLSYHPSGITKKEKSTTPSQSGKPGFKRAEVSEAATKYNVDRMMVQFMVTQRNITPDAAAKELAENRAKKLAAKQAANTN